MIDTSTLRADFPILSRTVRDGKVLVYLDSGATAQRPRAVLEAERHFAETSNGAVKRGAHQLAEEATDAYEGARVAVGTFIGAARPEEVVFTKNATESLNLIAYAIGNGAALGGQIQLGPGDEVVVTEMEHHANLVPWQQLCLRTGASLRHFAVTDDFRLDTDAPLIGPATKVLALTHQSNVLGTVNPVAELAAQAHQYGALVVVDCAQSVPHQAVSVAALGADVIAFSGHKMLASTGIGVLWGRYDLLAELPPFLTGGSMIEQVYLDHSTFAAPPARFEAGTPPVVQAVGLGAAIEYLSTIGMTEIEAHIQELTALALAGLQDISGVHILGPGNCHQRGGAVSFLVDGVHPHDVGQVLDAAGVQVRVGHHCAWPLHRRFGVSSSTRASFGLYNTADEVTLLCDAVRAAQRYFRRSL